MPKNSRASVAPRKSKNVVKLSDAKLSALRSDLDALQEHMNGVVGDVGNIATDGAQAALASAKDIAERAYRLAEEARANVTEEVEVWADENVEAVRDQVRAKPVSAVALSMVAGVSGYHCKRSKTN